MTPTSLTAAPLIVCPAPERLDCLYSQQIANLKHRQMLERVRPGKAMMTSNELPMLPWFCRTVLAAMPNDPSGWNNLGTAFLLSTASYLQAVKGDSLFSAANYFELTPHSRLF